MGLIASRFRAIFLLHPKTPPERAREITSSSPRTPSSYVRREERYHHLHPWPPTTAALKQDPDILDDLHHSTALLTY